MSSIGYYNERDEWIHQCGATLISKNHFLTAAHCVSGSESWKIHVGDFNFSIPRSQQVGVDVDMKKITRHPEHKDKSPYYDVAIIETDPVNFTDFIFPICLSFDPKIRDDARVDLLGWGSASPAGKTSNLLQRISLTLYPNEHCNKTHFPRGIYESDLRKFVPDLFPSHLACAGIEFGRHGACKGDSGGPLQFYNTTVHRYYQVAVVHGAFLGCGNPQYPGVYVRLEDPAIISFIKTALESDPKIITLGPALDSPPDQDEESADGIGG